MLAKLRHTVQGVAVLLGITINTVTLTVVIFVLAVVKLLAPPGRPRHLVTAFLSSVGELWISVNSSIMSCYRGLTWDVELPPDIDPGGRYLIFSNHRSWVDIMVLQRCLNRRAPFMRFLLKQQLIWVPFLGFAWWALDMAFLRRYDAKQLLKNPELRGKDLESAARACEKLRHIPVSMMTFPEGTRFTTAKHARQKSPFDHLLRPRMGGIGQILYSFRGDLDGLIDVTIVYPDGTPGMWQFLSGQVRRVSVRVRVRAIEEAMQGVDFREDHRARSQLKRWVTDLWEEKDRMIESQLTGHRQKRGQAASIRLSQ
jgi:1-acyl-sn-glycerol-3-phosphate acyltransferase